MSHSDKIILVTGATGQQGGATARRLLADGWQVRALTRTPSSSAAKALKAAGAHLVTGDLSDPASLEVALRGAYGVFSVQSPPMRPGQSPDFGWEEEISWGRNVADVAKAAGVHHLVYTSAIGADRRISGLRNLENKWEIEQHIRSLDLPATILRPVSFMENYVHPLFGLRDGQLMTALRPGVRQELIAVDDIGAFAAFAFADPDRYRGRAIDIAGDELTGPQIADAISRATGRSVPYVQIPIDVLRQTSEEAARGYEALNAKEESWVDVPALREEYPSLMDFETWLERTGAARIKELLAA
ncbi:NmrA/HSCARG family protein [Actinopolymorpha alba]|uniref:NmrA/HSCARG family protein n=1 Tax=Actinopolymorpha alba TaxID=533267 RepID=UPI0003805197|nr:NmrA/HSCARG family protein [Actinopolymorpha alba]